MRLTVEEGFRGGLATALGPDAPARLGVAVSGGSDSTALLLLAAGVMPVVTATVDHGLRPASAGEARAVAALAGRAGVAHRTLAVAPWSGTGNLQAWARDARLAALRDWAAEEKLTHVALGHTRDDQAETVLLRLMRGSGVDGLAAMAPRRQEAALCWVRPLLSLGRQELRDWLRARDVAWSDDPSNDEARFDRVAVRRAIATLVLDPARLAATARHMRAAREVLQLRATEAATRLARVEAGEVVFAPALWDEPEETRMRLLAAALGFVSGARYRPRYAALAQLADRLAGGGAGTLQGCRARGRGEIRVGREPAALEGVEAAPGALWDRRWCVTGPAQEGLVVRALGMAGLAACDWRASGLPRETLATTPAVWDGARLVAAPVAGVGPEWSARLAQGRDHFTLAAVLR